MADIDKKNKFWKGFILAAVIIVVCSLIIFLSISALNAIRANITKEVMATAAKDCEGKVASEAGKTILNPREGGIYEFIVVAKKKLGQDENGVIIYGYYEVGSRHVSSLVSVHPNRTDLKTGLVVRKKYVFDGYYYLEVNQE